MKKKKKLVVLGIVENNKGQVLISQRHDPKVKEAHLKWDLIGGTNEFGESLAETAKREIFEETGMNVKVLRMLPECASKFWEHKDFLQYTHVFCYICKLIGGKLHLEDHKINKLKWVNVGELDNFEFLPTTKVFIDIYIKQI
jgi:8-oxo-dGTP pyrophosphatase MutT (NUDIX family)